METTFICDSVSFFCQEKIPWCSPWWAIDPGLEKLQSFVSSVDSTDCQPSGVSAEVAVDKSPIVSTSGTNPMKTRKHVSAMGWSASTVTGSATVGLVLYGVKWVNFK